MNIALVISYFGAWPVWFPAFLQSCKYNPGVDWIFFTDCGRPDGAPDNVTFVPFTLADFNALASEKLGFSVQASRAFKMCDFRPAFGLIFEEYLDRYDFWGHCDVDVIWGDIRAFITDDILTRHAIISARKENLCGHFTLYQRHRRIETLFTRHPDHRTILQSTQSFGFDERGMTRLVKRLIQQEALAVYWPTFLLNFAHPTTDKPSLLGRHTNRWRWEKGKLYDRTDEVMYLHFMTWKHSLQGCYFDYGDDPASFYVSFSHIGLCKTDRPPLGALLAWEKQRARRHLRSLKKKMRAWLES